MTSSDACDTLQGFIGERQRSLACVSCLMSNTCYHSFCDLSLEHIWGCLIFQCAQAVPSGLFDQSFSYASSLYCKTQSLCAFTSRF
jgi:hypothetical protein